MDVVSIRYFSKFYSNTTRNLCLWRPQRQLFEHHPLFHHRFICIERKSRTRSKQWRATCHQTDPEYTMKQALGERQGIRIVLLESQGEAIPVKVQLFQNVHDRRDLRRKILGTPAFPSIRKCDSFSTVTSFPNSSTEVRIRYTKRSLELVVHSEELGIIGDRLERVALKGIRFESAEATTESIPTPDQLSAEDCEGLGSRLAGEHKHIRKEQVRSVLKEEDSTAAAVKSRTPFPPPASGQDIGISHDSAANLSDNTSENNHCQTLMTSDSPKPASETTSDSSPAHHRPLVVGLTKPSSQSSNMASEDAAAALNKEIEKNLSANTKSAAPAEVAAESSQPKQKKEKAPKQPKPQKAAPPTAPTSPALIDLRVGHILRAIAHPNADSLYVSTIAMGDPEGTDHTQIDEETGKVVRTVCSGLNGLIPLAEMQDRKIIVVANLKPVNMRSIKSAAMVLAASPKQEEGADPHAPDRVVELVVPPEGSEAGDKVYFEGWPYGEGKGPEKQLNPKKKQWEAIQPGFYTSDDLLVGFDASKCDEVEGSEKGNLVVDGKGSCKVKTLKGAVVR